MSTPLIRKRCHRYNLPGHSHFLTFSCFRRLPLLGRDRTRNWLASAIEAARESHDFAVLAWVFMPEHAHLLIAPQRREYDISAILKSIKQPVTQRAVHYLRAHAPTFLVQLEDRQPNGDLSYRFWQRGGGYDRNIVGATEYAEKIGYIHRNPVKRGLVSKAEEWEWSSAGDFMKMSAGPIRVDTVLTWSLTW